MNERRTDPDDQINLIGIKSAVFSILQSLFELQSFIFLAIRRKIWLITGGLVLGLLIGLAYHNTKQELYKGSMVVTYHKFTKKTYVGIIDQLNILASNGGSTTTLASELRIPQALAANIVLLGSSDIYNTILKEDTSTKVNQPFKIIVDLRSNNDLDSLQQAIIFYLNNRPHLKKLSEIERKLNLEKIEYIDKDIQKLDSLKSEFNRSLASSKSSLTFYNNAINPADIYIQSTELFKQKALAEKMLFAESDAVSLLDGLKTVRAPQSTSLIIRVAIFGSIGLLAGFLIALLIETKRELFSKINKQDIAPSRLP
jgi:hypothetical protein